MKLNNFFRLAFSVVLIVLVSASALAQSISGAGTTPADAISPVSTHTYTFNPEAGTSDVIQWEISGGSGTITELSPTSVSISWQGTPGGGASLIASTSDGGAISVVNILAIADVFFGCDVPLGPIAVSGNTRIGETVTLSLENSFGSNPIDWELQASGETPLSIGTGQLLDYTFLNTLSPGDYEIKASAVDLCGNISVFSFPITLRTSCEENAQISLFQNQSEICLNDERILQISYAIRDDYTWTFSDGAQQVIDPALGDHLIKVQFTGSGLQTVTGTPINPVCAAYPVVFSQVISAPIASVSGPDVTCEGLTKIYTVVGGASTGVTWNLPAGVTKIDLNPEQRQVALTFTSEGDKQITVTNAGSTCVSGSHTFTVSVLEEVAKVSTAGYTNAELNGSPEPLELTTNSCYDQYGDCGTQLTKVDVYASFSLGKDNYFAESEDALASVQVNVAALDFDGNILYEENNLTISLNKLEPLKVYHFSLSGAQAEAVRTFELTPAAGSYTVSSEIDAEKVGIEFYYEEERQVDAANAILELTSPISSTPTLTGSYEHTFQWRVKTEDYSCSQVPGYQLQVMRIYGDGTATPDWRGATNVYSESPETNLMLALAEGSGSYAWRVRPIGNLLGDTKYALSNPANWDENAWVAGSFTFEQPDEDKNFIYSRTFTEKGRVSEQMGFANGLGQITQQQVKLHSQGDQIVATETLQDFIGRDALSSLPVPLVGKSTFGYHNAVLSNGTSTYSASDFDVNPQSAAAATTFGNYYGGDITGVASAEGVPYARTLYTNDGTGRVKEQAAVGATHALTSDRTNTHTIRTYYSSVDEGELVAIFGQEAPSAKDVHKIITYDANNVGSAAYIDKGGEIIATAIDAGAANDALLDLDGVDPSDKVIFSRIEGNTRRNAYSVSSQKPLFFSTPKEITLKYNLTPAQSSDICNQLCKSCDYLVEFILHNQDEPDLGPEVLGTYTIDGGNCGQGTWTLPEVDNELTANLAAETNYVLERRISTHQKTEVLIDEMDPTLGTKEVYWLDLYLGEIATTVNTAVDALFPDLQTHLDSGDPAAVYTYLESLGYTLDTENDEYVIPVTYGSGADACTEYIIIPKIDDCEGIPDALCKVDGNTWEAYFANFWNEEGKDYATPVDGKLTYAFFDDLYAKELEEVAASSEGREVDETAFRSYYAPTELDQMINNLLTLNGDRLSCEDIWNAWRQEVFAYDSYAEPDLSGAPGIAVFENDLVGRFIQTLEAILDSRKPENSDNICATAADGSETIMVRDKVYGKINDDPYPINAEFINPKLHAFRLIYLNTDNENQLNLFRILANEDVVPPVVIDENTSVSITDFDNMSACQKYKLYKLNDATGVSSGGQADAAEQRSKMISECEQVCEDRSEEFKQAIVEELLGINPNFIFEHHNIINDPVLEDYVAIFDETANTEVYDYSVCELEVMVNGLVENCKTGYCNLDFTNADQATTDANFEKLEKVFFHDFDLQVHAEGIACAPDWNQINTNGITRQNAYNQLWVTNNLNPFCGNYAPVISTFDQDGNVIAVLTPRYNKYSYTLNNGEEIRDDTGNGKFAVVKFTSEGAYLWHNEYYLDLGNTDPLPQINNQTVANNAESIVANDDSPFEDISLKVNSNGDISFTTVLLVEPGVIGVNKEWKLMKDGSLEYEFTYDDATILIDCEVDFPVVAMSAALSSTGNEKWFQYGNVASMFNTVDDLGNTYVMDYTELYPSVIKTNTTGNAVWTSQAIEIDGDDTGLGASFPKLVRSSNGDLYSYVLYNSVTQRTVTSNGTVLGTLPAGQRTGILTKYDPNGNLVWVWFNTNPILFNNLVAKDDHVLLIEALDSGIGFHKLYSTDNIQSDYILGAPVLGDFFNTQLRPHNHLLIYNQGTVNDGVSSMNVNLDDYSFSLDFDLRQSDVRGLRGVFYEFGTFKKYLITPFNDGGKINSYTVPAGGYIAAASVFKELSCPVSITLPDDPIDFNTELPQSIPSIKGGAAKLLYPTICFQWNDTRVGDIVLPDDDDFVYDPVLPTCESLAIDRIQGKINSQKAMLSRKKQEEFRETYVSRCTAVGGLLEGSLATADRSKFYDEFTISYSTKLHHYMLYYYDRAGNLISTVPPKGVQVLDVADASELATAKTTLPVHTYRTNYQYNSLGQLVSQQTPDAGRTDFIYNDIGQIRFAQDAQQKLEGKYSYTHYDALSRIIEVGEATGDFDTEARANRNLLNWPASGEEVTHTVYNTPYTAIAGNDLPTGYEQSSFLRNRISYTYQVQDGVEMEDDAGNVFTPVVTTIYSYDVHGNVAWLVQEIPGLGQKTIDYTYDLLNGNVKEVAYNKGGDDQFYHRYSYDQDNRIVKVETSKDRIIWERDAKYKYYAHGPLRQTVVAEDKVQKQDYLYTIQGWLKAINDPASPDGPISNVTRDAYAMILHYYSGDYMHSNGGMGKLGATEDRNLYNGNISAWENANQNKTGVWTRSGMQYKYDKLNRIKSSDFNVHRKDDGLGVDQFFSRKAFATNYTFDPNGNLLTLNRDDFDGELMDELEYTLEAGKNRLASVEDLSTLDPEKHKKDIEGLNNYQYDAIGNLILDEAEDISIDWTGYGKVRSTSNTVEAGVGTEFLYDAAGNRVVKRSTNKYGLVTSDYYIRDASGNVMAIYKSTTGGDHSESTQSEVPIYGSDRLGMYKPGASISSAEGVSHTLSVVIDLPAYVGVSEYHLEEEGGVRLLPGFEFNAGVEADEFLVDQAAEEGAVGIENLYVRELNKKAYELKDHLGNVRATVSDVRQPLPDGEEGYMATVLTSSDYYPYGMDRTPVVWEPVEYLATYEDNDYETFLNHEQADVINASDFNHTQETGTSHSQRLNADAGKAIGLARMLYVKPGDKVNMEVFGTYRATNADPQNLMTNLVVGLAATIPGADAEANLLRNSINNESAVGTFFNRTGNDDVKAYLNYLFFDGSSFEVDNDYSGFVPLTSAGEFKPSDLANSFEKLSQALVAEKEGFLYIYLSDESQEPTEVYFDDFKITHEVLIKDPQLETYRYGFNGKEKDSNGEFGLNHYDYGFRIYNPAIAKFLSVDPLTKGYPMLTPYQFASNRPIDGIDLDGLEWFRPYLLRPIGLGTPMFLAQDAAKLRLKNPNMTLIESVARATWDRNTVMIHTTLDVAGFFPGLGEGADLINIGIYTLEGDYLNAALSSLSLAPIGGDIAAKGLKYSLKFGDKVLRNFKNFDAAKKWVNNAVEYGTRYADEFAAFKPCGCFTDGTKVLTEKGYVNIEEVRVGDKVWSFSDSTNKKELKVVEELFSRTWNELYRLFIDTELIEATHEHPFYTKRGWVKAQDLTIGDSLQLFDGHFEVLDSVHVLKGEYMVYNLIVEDYHTYYVSNKNILVHNGKPCNFGFAWQKYTHVYTDVLTKGIHGDVWFKGRKLTEIGWELAEDGKSIVYKIVGDKGLSSKQLKHVERYANAAINDKNFKSELLERVQGAIKSGDVSKTSDRHRKLLELEKHLKNPK